MYYFIFEQRLSSTDVLNKVHKFIGSTCLFPSKYNEQFVFDTFCSKLKLLKSCLL